MSSSYSRLKVLIVDDFNNFRMTLIKIMHEMGFLDVDSASSGEVALNYCRKSHYDLILSDYNLGQGKNGLQLLEELRINELLQLQDVFILLSAETSRNVVMSAFDCEPDAYLTKPITTKVIEQRLKRLMNKRSEMLDVYDALSKKEIKKAISHLEDKLSGQTRYSMDCQKSLADLYIQDDQLEQAEKIYRTVLEMRALDWAQVGLADVKMRKGDPRKAVEWLNKIIEDNTSCMKAYDVLSQALEKLNDQEGLQENLENAVEISPMSLGRQVSLANVAIHNGDAEVAANAFRKMMKYGANSCHDTIENQLNYVKSIAQFYDKDAIKADDMSKDAIKILSIIEDKDLVDPSDKVKAQLLGSQIWGLRGESRRSQELLELANDALSDASEKSIDVEIEIVHALTAIKKVSEAQRKTNDLIVAYENDQSALEKIDPLLQEPVSEKGKKRLAKANKKGIDSYKNKQYESAIDSFSKVEKRYPRYVGVKLNLVQALIGKIREEGGEDADRIRCNAILKTIERSMSPDNTHFNRYRQLKDMLNSLLENNR